MTDAPVRDRPKAENGILFVGPWGPEQEELVRSRWRSMSAEALQPGVTRIDLSGSPRGSCPGFNDDELLAELSGLHPRCVAFGFFCDSTSGAEGVRVFEGGRQADRRRVAWAETPTDPVTWPIAALAVTLRMHVEMVTRVERPERPALALAAEAVLADRNPPSGELLHQALGLLGHVEHEAATRALMRYLAHEDWVARFHAAQAYVRIRRGQGEEGRPPLDSLLADEDESVREATFRGIIELLPTVEFQETDLQRQIERALKKGAEDEDEDVREAAAEARALKQELLG